MRPEIRERIEQAIRGHRVVLFMKGTPALPMCGFSAAVARILDDLGVEYRAIDVLEDPELREGIKEFSNWPTLPQLYVNGSFVGGCDIVRELYARGELDSLLRSPGNP
jgi:monothiol glutaredoxin